MKKIFFLLSLLIASNISWGQNVTPGITVLLHGFDAQGGGGIETWQNNAILIREYAKQKTGKNSIILMNDVKSGFWKVLDKEITGIDYLGLNYGFRFRENFNYPVNGFDGEIIFLYDWGDLSNDNMVSTREGEDALEAAADNLFAMLIQPVVAIGDYKFKLNNNSAALLLTKQLHFICHSRGNIVALQVFNRLRKYFPTLQIDQWTALDPHPASKMGDIESTLNNVVSQSLPYVFGSAGQCDNNVWISSLKGTCGQNINISLEVPENVKKVDNYYRQSSNYEPLNSNYRIGEFSGVLINRASMNRQMSNSIMTDLNLLNDRWSILGGAHSQVVNWYIGTFDFLLNSSFTNFKGQEIVMPKVKIANTNWYTNSIGTWFEGVKILSGYNYSRIGGNYNSSQFPLVNGISVNNTNKRTMKSPTNDDFFYGNKAGWKLNGGASSFDVPFNEGNITLFSQSYISHSFFYFPNDIQKVKLRAKYRRISGSLTGDINLVFRNEKNDKIFSKSVSIPASVQNTYADYFIELTANELSQLRGKVGRIGILSNKNNDILDIQEVSLVNVANGNLRISNSQNLSSINNSYLNFAVSYDVNPTPLIKGVNPLSFKAIIQNTLTSSWNGTLIMTWRKVTDVGKGITLVSTVANLLPNETVTLDRGTNQIISETGEYILAIYANNDDDPIDLYHFYVTEPLFVQPDLVNIDIPNNISYGNSNVGSTTDRTLTITNAASSTINLTGSVSNIIGVDMNIASGSQTLNLSPGQSQNLTLRFSPQSGGNYNNSINVTGNFTGGTKTVSLTGSASTVIPTLTYSNSPNQTYPLLDASMGNFSDGIITVSNYSTSAFSGSFAVTGNGYSGILMGGSGSNLNIPAGGSQSITVRFTPTANGVSTGSLSITGSATNTPATFNFSALGKGFPTSGCVVTSVNTITNTVNISVSGWREFGRFTLTNSSNNLPANISNFGAGPSDNFRIAGYQQDAQFSLNPNEVREFVIEVSPFSNQVYYSGIVTLSTASQSCNTLNIQLRGTPAVSALNPPPLVDPAADFIRPYMGFESGINLGIKLGNIFGVARYKYFLKDMTLNQVILDNYDGGVAVGGNSETMRGFNTYNGVNRFYRPVNGHRYSWKVRAESVSDPNVYADSELRYFSIEQPSICYAPTDLLISSITKNSALVTWNLVPTSYTNPPTYNIEVSSDNGATFNTASTNGTGAFNLTGTSYVINSLVNAQNYKVRVITNCLTCSCDVSQYTRSQPSPNKSFTTLAECSGQTASVSPSSQQSICEGASTIFTATSGSNYQWYKDDLPINGANSQTYSANLAGTFKVKIGFANGCEIFSNSVVTTITAKPVVSVSSSKTGICPTGTVVLTATSLANTTYQWLKNDIIENGATSIQYTASSSGVYKVNYVQNGCNFTTDLYNLAPFESPLIYITGNNNLSVGNTLSLEAFGANTYSWSGPNNLTSLATSISIPNVLLSNGGNYSVNGVGLNGCNSTVNFNVNVSPAACTQMYTLKSGNWLDSSVWSCGRIPNTQDNILIKTGHNIFLNIGQTGYCKFINTENGAVLNTPLGAILIVSPN